MQQSNSIRFEIRNGIENAYKHSPLIQAGYDQMNRMVNLLGHIKFADLFGQTFDKLIPRIVPHVARCAEYGLIGEPETVVELLNQLQRHNGQDSFAALTALAGNAENGAAFPNDASAVLHQLGLFHGIYLPQLVRRTQVMLDMHEGILELIEYAGDLSYRAMAEMPMTKDLRTAKIAVSRAVDRQLIFMIGTYTCCYGTMCGPGLPTDACWTSRTGGCITGSTPCGNTQALANDGDCGCC